MLGCAGGVAARIPENIVPEVAGIGNHVTEEGETVRSSGQNAGAADVGTVVIVIACRAGNVSKSDD